MSAPSSEVRTELNRATGQSLVELFDRLKQPDDVVAASRRNVTAVHVLKRFTLVVHDGRVIKTFYPVLPSDQNAEAIRAWLARRAGALD